MIRYWCVIPLRIKLSLIAFTMCLLGCSVPQTPDVESLSQNNEKARKAIEQGIKADAILVDKSDRVLILYQDNKEITRYENIQFGDQPMGHKQFEGDEKTPEGDYFIDARNPASSYHLSLRISYPNTQDKEYAQRFGRSAGGDIFIHGQPNRLENLQDREAISYDWTDGCIALSNVEIRQLWELVPNGARITIRP